MPYNVIVTVVVNEHEEPNPMVRGQVPPGIDIPLGHLGIISQKRAEFAVRDNHDLKPALNGALEKAVEFADEIMTDHSVGEIGDAPSADRFRGRRH